MRLENMKCIEEQLSSMEDGFETLRDNCYWIRKCIQDEVKIAKKSANQEQEKKE